MKRLTEKHNGQFGFDSLKSKKVANKLGQLEDIEEELGIDLITLNKICQQGLYYKKEAFVSYIDTMSNCLKKGVIYYAPNEDIHCELFGKYSKPQMGASIMVFVPPRNAYYSLKLTDYGKTWALTKKELENV